MAWNDSIHQFDESSKNKGEEKKVVSISIFFALFCREKVRLDLRPILTKSFLGGGEKIDNFNYGVQW